MMEAQGMDDGEQWINNSGWNYYSFAQGNSMAPISYVHFDNIEDRLWTGNETGRVVSYNSAACQRHTAFVQAGPIRSIETFEGGVLSLTPTLLRAQTRSGLPLFSFSSDKITNMICMHQPTEGLPHVYLGGESPCLLHFDVESQRELRMAKLTSQKDVCAVRTNGKSVLTADSDGNIGVRDVNSLENCRMLNCHGGPVIDFDVIGNQLISCGASFRAGAMHGDPYVKIYDLRTFRHLPPIPLSFAPIFTRFLPSYTTGKMIFVAQLCQVQLHDLNDNSGVPLLIESGGVPLTSFAYSPSRQVMAFGDAAGNAHLYSDREDAMLNDTQVQSEYADMPSVLPQSFGIDDTNHSLASIPLPFSYDDGYLSDWPEEYCEYAYRKARPLPEYTAIRTHHTVQYAANPRAGTPLARFHLCPYDLEKREVKEDSSSRDSDGVQTEDEGETMVAVPKYYRPCVWKQAIKGGDDTSSLIRFNRSSRVPIEYNNGANFANPLIQLLYSIPSLRNLFLHHLCHDDHCLSCHLGFVFRMISDREPSQPASSNNLMRSLRASSFCALAAHITAGEKVQHLLQYLFEDVTKNLSPSDHSHLSGLTTFFLTTNSRCVRCSCVNSEGMELPFLKISYPTGDVAFCTLLEKTLNGRSARQAQCGGCQSMSRIDDSLRVRTLPPLLVLDANPTASNYISFWKDALTRCERRPKYANPPQETEKSERACRWGDECRNKSSCKYAHGSASEWEDECMRWMEEGQGTWTHYVPHRFYARISGGIAALQEKEPDSNDTTESHAYDLVAVVCTISEDPSNSIFKYAVAEIMEEWSAEGAVDSDAAKTWLIINGIAITRVSQDEALHFDHRWKLPAVMVYAKRKSLVMTATETRMSIPLEVFARDSSLTGNDELVKERRLLDLPQKGDIVGIDAEFISMSKDGSKKCVGRVSVVDASGEQIIMDDYIVGIDGEIVHDYLTQYSGIMEHDLCRLRSKKHLTTLKASYIKLLHLIERGVIFVGHALFNDFSMLNIHVPPGQVRDTVQLFRLPQQRLISLQFLAYHLLDQKIQESTHDSVEDARVSLLLYGKWKELQEAGTLEGKIRWLYEEGKSTNWRLSTGSTGSNSLPITSSRESLPTTPTKGGTPTKEDSPENEN